MVQQIVFAQLLEPSDDWIDIEGAISRSAFDQVNGFPTREEPDRFNSVAVHNLVDAMPGRIVGLAKSDFHFGKTRQLQGNMLDDMASPCAAPQALNESAGAPESNIRVPVAMGQARPSGP